MIWAELFINHERHFIYNAYKSTKNVFPQLFSAWVRASIIFLINLSDFKYWSLYSLFNKMLPIKVSSRI